jgi:hypothetical protein
VVKRGRPYLVEIVRRALDSVSIDIDDLDYIIPAAANSSYFSRREESVTVG